MNKNKFGIAGLALVIVAVIMIFAFAVGCKVLPPTDAEINYAKARVEAAPAGSDEQAEAKAELARLLALKEAADKNASGFAGFVGLFFPGAGAAIGILYGIACRIKNAKTQSMNAAIMQGIEEYKKIGGPDAVAELVAKLKEQQNIAGVRDAVNAAMLKLKSPAPKPA